MAQRLVILKADDFGSGVHENFRKLIELGRRWRVPISIGVIANRLPLMRKCDISYFRSCFEDPLLEVWNHSSAHRDFTTLSYENQVDDIRRAQNQINSDLGVLCDVFGAPYNKYNIDTIKALGACPEFKSVYLLEEDLAAQTQLVNAPRRSLVSPEFVRPWSRQNHFIEFVRRCDLKRSDSLLTVQFHPPAWNPRGFAEFERCIEYMLDQGFRFVTMAEFVELRKIKSAAEKDTKLALSVRVAAVQVDEKLEVSNKEMGQRYSGDSRVSEFFFNRHVLGTQHVVRSLEQVDFDQRPGSEVSDGHTFLDIGCGSGNWLVGYGLLHPEAQLFGLDKLEPCVETARASLAAAGMSGRASIVRGAVDETVALFERRFNRVSCINAAQYMNKESLFRFAHRSLKHQGDFLLSVQTPEYFLGAAWQALTSAEGKLDQAFGRLDTIVSSFERRLGVMRRVSSVHAYEEREIVFMAKQSSFEVSIEGVGFESRVPQFRGLPYMRSFLFVNRYTRDDEDNGYGSFCALSEELRASHLNDLRNFGAWLRIKELIDNCKGLIPSSMESDLRVLSCSMTSGAPLHGHENPAGNYSELARCAIALNSGDYANARPRRDFECDAELGVFYALSSYAAGDYVDVLKLSEAMSSSRSIDPRVLIICAAAATRLGRIKVALESIDKYIQHRVEVLQ